MMKKRFLLLAGLMVLSFSTPTLSPVQAKSAVLKLQRDCLNEMVLVHDDIYIRGMIAGIGHQQASRLAAEAAVTHYHNCQADNFPSIAP